MGWMVNILGSWVGLSRQTLVCASLPAELLGPSAEAGTPRSPESVFRRIWRKIQQFYPDIPDASFKITTIPPRRGSQIRGTWRTTQSVERRATRGEVQIAERVLREGSESTVSTLLHEAVHAALAGRGGIQNTDKEGRHLPIFRDAAHELGLSTKYSKKWGWAHTTPYPSTLLRCRDDIEKLQRAIDAYLTKQQETS